MKTIYHVTVDIGTPGRARNRSFIFGSRYEADTFIEEAKAKYGVKDAGFSLNHVMTRKEALDEIRVELEQRGY